MGKLGQLFTFKKGGIHPPASKELTQDLAIEEMPVPGEIAVQLGQHIGAPAAAVVKKGDVIAQGQVIGELKAGLGTNVHASWAGKVKAVGNAGHPTKIMAPAVLIETDREKPAATYEKRSWDDMSVEALLDCIKNAGIVGAGGAGFPVHVKLKPPAGSTITELIVNGA